MIIQADALHTTSKLILTRLFITTLAFFYSSLLSANEQINQYGFGLGHSSIDIGSKNFNIAGQNISTNIDDSIHLQIFFVVPYDDKFGFEFSLASLGTFDFSGQVTSTQNSGTFKGEQKFQTFATSGHYKHAFKYFDSRVHVGVMQIRHETNGTLNLIGNDPQSLDNSKNSSNPFITVEASKKIYSDWFIGPALSYIDSGDPIQSLSLRLTRAVQ